jgi:hypothetical protein
MDARKKRWGVTLLAPLLMIGGVQCTETVAPTGASITLAVNPALIAVDGDSTLISAFVAEQSGDAVVNDTRVTFVTTLGGLCPTDDNSVPRCGSSKGEQLPSVVSARTKDGIATAHLRSGATPGTATITAKSGQVTSSITVAISGLVAPDNGRIAVMAAPAEVTVGGTTNLTALVLGGDGNTVLDGTRVRFTTTQGTVTPEVALTHTGYARTSLSGLSQAGTVTVYAISGAVKDSVTVTVR